MKFEPVFQRRRDQRVLGGRWRYNASLANSSNSGWSTATERGDDFGFRIYGGVR